MFLFEKYNEHPFYKLLIEDDNKYLHSVEYDRKSIEFNNPDLDELQYYIHGVGFALVYLFRWCQQLELAVEFLSNYSYKNKSSNIPYSRIDHVIYNIENYIIRFHSLDDRVLQLINKVFHLTINKEEVKRTVVLKNHKVTRTSIPSLYKPIKNHIFEFDHKVRDTIIHQHSFLDTDLKRLEKFYYSEIDRNNEDYLIHFRAQKLRDYLKEEKKKFSVNNEKAFKLLSKLLDELQKEYLKERKRLEKIVI